MSIDAVMSNGNGTTAAVAPRSDTATVVVPEQLEPDTVSLAADLLSHLWSRPVPAEVETWAEAREVLAETHSLISSTPAREPVQLPESGEVAGLLDGYENLFVGPGQVPCPPYESFWREDVPVDIRRTLMGPCTAELKDLYRELGLQVSAGSGELPDHVAIELEALAYALASPETEGVARRICQEHLAQFVPRLCRAVTHDAESAFYRDLASLTLDWMAGIRGYFALAESG